MFHIRYEKSNFGGRCLEIIAFSNWHICTFPKLSEEDVLKIFMCRVLRMVHKEISFDPYLLSRRVVCNVL